VVTGMTNAYAAQARTALSPEWDHGFDEAFTDLIAADPDLVREEFDALIGANFTEPPEPSPPPVAPARSPEPPRPPAGNGRTQTAQPADQFPADPSTTQRSPP
jgi:hypothetical protein